jgi:hypothetical protein
MYKCLIFFVSLFSLTGKLHSQKTDSLKYKYTNQTIYRYGGSFMKGNERLSFMELSREFSMSDLGLISYTKSKKYKNTSKIFSYASMFAGFAAISVLANHGNRNLAFGFYGGQMVCLFGSMRYRQLSAQSLDRALWQRNKDLLFPERQ